MVERRMTRVLVGKGRRGFTLIELLVVIAVIALLIGILLPSLAKARLVGYKVKSLANLRAIGTAGATYQDSYKGYLPLVYHKPSGRGMFTRRDTGTQRLRAADAFVPSRLTWVTDQYSDIVVYNFSDNFQIKNGYGDFNKSLMGFMDGHAAYHPVYSGGQERSFKNEFYSFVFDDLPAPIF
jgi:prepilin-type N-terminal cleavage/methylation domain-containing protein